MKRFRLTVQGCCGSGAPSWLADGKHVQTAEHCACSLMLARLQRLACRTLEWACLLTQV